MESNPTASITWLTGSLPRFRHKIEAGNAIITSSFTQQPQFERRLEVEVYCEPFDTPSTSFTRGDT